MPLTPISRIIPVVAPLTLVALGAVLVVAGRSPTPAPPIVIIPPTVPIVTPPPAPPPPSSLLARIDLLDPIVVGSLAVTPIALRDDPGLEPDLAVMDEAMASGDLTVTETGEVGRLHFTNRGARPVLLLGGEVILGGRQDRIIATTTLVPPHADARIAVYCVEHGRWDGSAPTFASAHRIAHERLRARASYHGQGEVWQEVGDANAANGIANATGTYRDLAARQGGSLAARLAIEHPLAGARVVGFAETVGGKLVDVEVFAGPALFAKLRGKLVDAMLADAAGAPGALGAPADTAAVHAFLDTSRSNGLVRSYDTAASHTQTFTGDRAGMVDVTSPELGEIEAAANAD